MAYKPKKAPAPAPVEEVEVKIEKPKPLAVGDTIMVDKIFRTQDSDRPVVPLVRKGRIQKIDPHGHHTYLVEGIGWTDKQYIHRP